MRRVVALVLGGLTMGVVYMLGAIYCQYLAGESGRSPESYLWLAFLVFAPLACLIGGGTSGAVAGTASGRPLVDALLLSPGLYIGLLAIVPAFLGATIEFALSMLLPAALWTAASSAGFLAARALRNRHASQGRAA